MRLLKLFDLCDEVGSSDLVDISKNILRNVTNPFRTFF